MTVGADCAWWRAPRWLWPSLAASLALHALVLFWPGLGLSARPAPWPDPPLIAHITAPVLTTETEAPSPPEGPAPMSAPLLPLDAGPRTPVLPPSTFSVPPVPPPPDTRPPDPRPAERARGALVQEMFYPREAVLRGQEGTVTLLLSLDAGGRVLSARVAAGSGHALLDQAAVRAAGRIGPLSGVGREMLLPVEFRLE